MKQIFIMGCNRAGTTLLLNLFRCLEGALIINGEFPPHFMSHFKAKAEENGHSALVMKRVMGPLFGNRMPTDVTRGNQYFTQSPTAWIDWIKEAPNVIYVHIRRDPRDIVVSKMKDRFYVGHFQMWKDAEAIYDRLKVEFPDNTYLVKYEGLVTVPDMVMSPIANDIGLAQVESFSTWNNQLDDQSKKHQSMLWMNGARPVDRDSIGNWSKTQENIDLIKKVIADNPDFAQTVVDYNYDTAGWEQNL